MLLDELKAMESRATPAFWAVNENGAVASFPTENGEDDKGKTVGEADFNEADMALVLAMRNALPKLLDVAERAVAWSKMRENVSYHSATEAAEIVKALDMSARALRALETP